MPSLKENLQVQASGASLAVTDGVFRVKQWYSGMPKWEQVLVVLLLILLIPGFFVIRYGGELFFTRYYSREALAVHPAFNNPMALEVGDVKLLQNPNATTTAYAVVINPNLDLALQNLDYTFNFLNANGEQVTQTTGSTYFPPDQKKWLVISKVQSLQSISKVTLTLGEAHWQKRANLIDVKLKMSEPYVYEELKPLATTAEGSVVNNSPYDLKQVSLLLVLYDKNNQVLAVTTREEFSVKAFERRAYKLQWPGIYRSDVARIDLQAYTNTLDPNNLSPGLTDTSKSSSN